ncbi:BrnA antitoxin family protein [Rhizobium sp. AN5]|uniref:BrnA antitoxin family protein n=1 Tax=Rhizobium sp. AN5 TaxID=1855304 RepID=UPI002B22385C|nr:BrnA antitoxin family protein [Rhizobium sp. AN5]
MWAYSLEKNRPAALFKWATKVAAPAVERPAIPTAKELVSLKIGSDVLAHFQGDGPGWQERINDTLRAVMNVSN